MSAGTFSDSNPIIITILTDSDIKWFTHNFSANKEKMVAAQRYVAPATKQASFAEKLWVNHLISESVRIVMIIGFESLKVPALITQSIPPNLSLDSLVYIYVLSALK